MDTNAVPYLTSGRIGEVKAAWRDAVEPAGPELAGFGERLLLRIAPPRWSLEWSLPYWLADAFHLSPEQAFALTLANVLGLGYVRLQDDLLDRDLAAGEAGQAVALSTLLYLEWARQFAGLCPPEDAFWDRAAAFLGQWGRATQDSLCGEQRPFDRCGEEDFRLLAHRGAPLKICVAAACSLARCEDRLVLLSAALDELMAAEVLLDHAHDWEQDVAAGQYNVFLSCVSHTPQVAAGIAQYRRLIMAEWVTGSGAAPYFDEIDRRLAACSRSADLAGLPALAGHAQLVAATVHGRRHAVLNRIHAALQQAAAAIWPTTDPQPAGDSCQEEHTMETVGASTNELELLIGKAFMEPEFGAWLLKDPAEAAASLGIKLNDAQVKQILSIDSDALNKLADQFRQFVGIKWPGWMELW